MIKNKASFLLKCNIAVLILLILESFVLYTVLPDTIASHYGPSLKSDSYMSKGLFLIIMVFAPAFLILLASLTSINLLKIPNRWINLPHKDYWLVPERRVESLGKFQELLLFIGCMIGFDFILMLYWVYDANMQKNASLSIWAPIALFAIVLIILIRAFFVIKEFYKIPRTHGSKVDKK